MTAHLGEWTDGRLLGELEVTVGLLPGARLAGMGFPITFQSRHGVSVKISIKNG